MLKGFFGHFKNKNLTILLYIFWSQVEVPPSTLRFYRIFAAAQDHCGRCRIRTRDICPRSLARCQWATTSHIKHFLIFQLPPNILASSFSLKMGLSENCAKTEGLGSLRLVCGQLLWAGWGRLVVRPILPRSKAGRGTGTCSIWNNTCVIKHFWTDNKISRILA